MDERTPGREPIILVELEQDQCTRTYGQSPCQALLGSTGQHKCFNTRRTCQDPENYDRGSITITFAEPRVNLPRDRNILPLLVSVSTNPTKLNVGGADPHSEPLGQRASVDILFSDAPYSDLLTDPYRDERISGDAQTGPGYDPLDRGTFWSKWLARNPFYQNRRVRIREGYVGQPVEEMRTRHYFIDRIDGPDASGRVRLRAKDVLKLADNDRAQWPRQSPGLLAADISAAASSFRVINASVSDYDPFSDGSGTVRIGDEIILWGSLSVDGDDLVFGSLTRGAERSTADSHDEEDGVQRCQRYTNANIVEVVQELLVTAGNVPSEFIPFADWTEERNLWQQGFNVSTLLTEPYGVTELLGELAEQCLFYIWWDERDQEIKYRAVRPIDPLRDNEPPLITDVDNVLAGTFDTMQAPEQRASQSWVLYRQIDPTEDVDEQTNYRRIRIRADANAEGANQYGEQRIRRVFARWLQADAQVLTVGTRILARYRDNPIYYKLQLDAKDRGIRTGDIVDLRTRQTQDFTGAERTIRCQVIRSNEIVPGHKQEYTLQRFDFTAEDRFGFFMAAGSPTYSNADDTQRETGAFFSVDAEGFDDSTGPYTFI